MRTRLYDTGAWGHWKERFFAKIALPKETTCWVYTGARDGRGYGRFFAYGKLHATHRWAYERFVGPIPKGMTLDHLCCDTSCCNPEHLEPVTVAENVRRAFALKTHCVHGHNWIPENFGYRANGTRYCKICERERKRRERRVARDLYPKRSDSQVTPLGGYVSR